MVAAASSAAGACPAAATACQLWLWHCCCEDRPVVAAKLGLGQHTQVLTLYKMTKHVCERRATSTGMQLGYLGDRHALWLGWLQHAAHVELATVSRVCHCAVCLLPLWCAPGAAACHERSQHGRTLTSQCHSHWGGATLQTQAKIISQLS